MVAMQSFPSRPLLRRVRTSGVVLLGFWAAIAACAAPGQERDAARDDAGHPLPVGVAAARIVSLGPATTELLFAIGAGDRVVGRTVWDTYPPVATHVPSVGDPFPPNLEVIVALDPDLVVFYASPANAPAIERLDQMGIASISVRMDKLESVSRAARWFGALTGLEPRADSLASRFERRLDSLEHLSWTERPAGVVLTWDNPPIVIGAGSFLSELLTLAGARNAFGDIPDASPTVNIENIVARNPDFFLLTGGPVQPEWATRPEWEAVPAVRDGRFVRVEGTEFSWPSLRAIEAVARLTEAVAPYRGANP